MLCIQGTSSAGNDSDRREVNTRQTNGQRASEGERGKKGGRDEMGTRQRVVEDAGNWICTHGTDAIASLLMQVARRTAYDRRKKRLSVLNKTLLGPPCKSAEYCDEPVCLSVCLSAYDYLMNHLSEFQPNFLRLLPVVVAVTRSSSVGVATRLVFPVSWITSYFRILGPIQRDGTAAATLQCWARANTPAG